MTKDVNPHGIEEGTEVCCSLSHVTGIVWDVFEDPSHVECPMSVPCAIVGWATGAVAPADLEQLKPL